MTFPAAYPLESQAIYGFAEDLCAHGGSDVSLMFMKYLGLDWFAVSPPHLPWGRGFRHLDRACREVAASAGLDDVVQQWNTEIDSPTVYFVEISRGERQRTRCAPVRSGNANPATIVVALSAVGSAPPGSRRVGGSPGRTFATAAGRDRCAGSCG